MCKISWRSNHSSLNCCHKILVRFGIWSWNIVSRMGARTTDMPWHLPTCALLGLPISILYGRLQAGVTAVTWTGRYSLSCNRVCHYGGGYCDYYPGALSLSQVTSVHLMIKLCWFFKRIPETNTTNQTSPFVFCPWEMWQWFKEYYFQTYLISRGISWKIVLMWITLNPQLW